MEYVSLLIGLCVFHPVLGYNQSPDYAEENPPLNKPQFALEVEQGSIPDMFGNQHYAYPQTYQHFSRRFVPAYSYKENEEVPSAVDEAVQMESERDVAKGPAEIVPMRAPPEVVLEVVKQAKREAAKNPTKQVYTKNILRSGDYWNGAWKEEVEPSSILRTKSESKNPSKSVQAKIMPGSPLYDLVFVLKKMSPRLLYIINKND